MELIIIVFGFVKLIGLDKKIGNWIGGLNGEVVVLKVVDIV